MFIKVNEMFQTISVMSTKKDCFQGFIYLPGLKINLSAQAKTSFLTQSEDFYC